MTFISNSFQDKFLSNIDAELRVCGIHVLADTMVPYGLLKACFPMESGRLDWSTIGLKIESDVGTVSAFYGIDRGEACTLFLREQIALQGLSGGAYWINDCVDFVLHGNVLAFEKIFSMLLHPHGHIYLVGERGDWCLNVTFEDDLYFGFAPPRVMST